MKLRKKKINNKDNDEVSVSCLIPKMKTKKGKNNPNYKTGKYIFPNFCICGKQIKVGSQCCLKCNGLKHRKEKHWNYKHGLPKCLDCGKELKNYKNKRCYSCENKRKHKLGILNSKGNNNNRFGKLMKPNFIKYKGIWLRSSWEIAYAKYLDQRGIKWVYEPKAFDLGNCTYTPDFYLPEFNLYIEIKGYKSDIFNTKIKLFKKIYPTIIIDVLDKIKLQSIKIIK
jgi:hypothetical protein